MKKTALIWNAVFYAIQYSVSLFYIGYQYGEVAPFFPGNAYFLLPGVYLALLVIGIYMVNNWEYVKSRSYVWMTVATMVVIGLIWGFRLFGYFRGTMPDTRASNWDIFIYPAILFTCSVFISVIYIVCAVKTRKEEKNRSY